MHALMNARPRCGCGKAIFYSRKEARRHGARFAHNRHRGTYLCPRSGFWHLGRLSEVRRFGAAPAGVLIANRRQLKALFATFDPWVRGLVEDEMKFPPRLREVGLHVAVVLAEVERTEGRSLTMVELSDRLPEDYVELVSEPDEEWGGDAAGWLREVCRATVVEIAFHGVITLGLHDGVARIGPQYEALLEAAP